MMAILIDQDLSVLSAVGYMKTLKAISVLFILVFVLAISQGAYAAPIVSVTGQCHKQVTPDRVAIVMSAHITDKDPASAQKKASALYENLRKEVKKLNLKDQQLQTSSYSVNPEWDYANNKRNLRGYTAIIGLRVETSETSRTSELFSIAQKLGLQDVENPVTFLSPDLSQKEYESCLKTAVESARSKAEKMAEAAGRKIAELSALDESGQGVSTPPVPMGKMAMAEDDVAAEPKVGFEIKPELVEVTIFAKYLLK
jgi:uncharacterized protein YggE